MKAIVIYESLTGNTRRLSEMIADVLRSRDVPTTVCSVTDVDMQALSEADLVLIGSWTDGIFVIGQRPGRVGRLKALPALAGKDVLVFCTYALNSGKVLEKMAAIGRSLGANVIDGLAVRRDDLASGARDIADVVALAVNA